MALPSFDFDALPSPGGLMRWVVGLRPAAASRAAVLVAVAAAPAPAVFATVLAALTAAPAPAVAQEHTVRGVVVEADGSVPVAGATVWLAALPPAVTGTDGTFVFRGVAPGGHELEVQAFGYGTRRLALDVRSDTTVRVDLHWEPIPLDTLRAEAREVEVAGRVLDAVTGEKVFHGEVALDPVADVRDASLARFTFEDVPAGVPLRLRLGAIGYIPMVMPLVVEADTSLTLALEHDSVAILMMERQVWRVAARADETPLFQRVIPSEHLDWTPARPIHEVIKERIGGGNPDGPCLFIDDRKQMHPHGLWELSAADVARVEVFEEGAMIRVYTKRYVLGTATGREPEPIVFQLRPFGMEPRCR